MGGLNFSKRSPGEFVVFRNADNARQSLIGATAAGCRSFSRDAHGQEWHWYEHQRIDRVGAKRLGEADPF